MQRSIDKFIISKVIIEQFNSIQFNFKSVTKWLSITFLLQQHGGSDPGFEKGGGGGGGEDNAYVERKAPRALAHALAGDIGARPMGL